MKAANPRHHAFSKKQELVSRLSLACNTRQISAVQADRLLGGVTRPQVDSQEYMARWPRTFCYFRGLPPDYCDRSVSAAVGLVFPPQSIADYQDRLGGQFITVETRRIVSKELLS